jgi:hypothetical protein
MIISKTNKSFVQAYDVARCKVDSKSPGNRSRKQDGQSNPYRTRKKNNNNISGLIMMIMMFTITVKQLNNIVVNRSHSVSFGGN